MISYFSDVPMSPSTPMDLGFFKRLPARRALQELGPIDPKLNLRIAETLLTISAEQFLTKWNFDPISMKPKKGKFLWTPVKSRDEQTVFATSIVSQKSCPRIPSVFDIPKDSSPSSDGLSEEAKKRLNGGASPPTEGSSSSSAGGRSSAPLLSDSAVRTPSKVLLSKSTSRTPKTPRTTQRKITEFGCQRKRLYSKGEDDIEASPRKKLHLDTPSKISMTIV